jgi:hypothetical protein
MQNIASICIIECISIASTTISVVIMRWLLQISSPEKDMQWVKKQEWCADLKNLRFYRGIEYIHQINFKRIIAL